MTCRASFARGRDRAVRVARHSRLRGVLLVVASCIGAVAMQAPPVHAAAQPVVGMADSAALRATVFGTPPQHMAPLPATVPLTEIDIALPWTRPVPDVFWFNRRLRAWFSAQPHEAPLAVVIAGTGSGGNSASNQTLRAVLYSAGYHVLTLPSPTFPGFIVAASHTGVAGDLWQDSQDLYATIDVLCANLPRDTKVSAIDILGTSLGGAHAAVVKAIDAREHRLGIRRAVMINPPVSLIASIGRLDKLFAQSIGTDERAVERLYQRLYAELANAYRASNAVQLDANFLLGAAASILKTDEEFSAAIALTFRVALVNLFFAGDLYARTGVVVDPAHPPKVGEDLEHYARALRGKTFAQYFDGVFVPYYTTHRAGATRESLIAQSRLDIIADALRNDPDYYALTNSDDLILDRDELDWLKRTLGTRIAVYDHGGHLGNLGERQQVADLLAMLGGRWRAGAR